MRHPPTKTALRKAALAYRAGLSAPQRQRLSEQIMDRVRHYLQQQPEPVRAVLTYRAMPSEVDTGALFQLPDYRIFAPVTHHQKQMAWRLITPQTRWKKGMFGILEPAAGHLWQQQEATVLLCPLTAFDRQGNRLGMGKGCFDFWLSRHRRYLDRVIGLAFSGQEVAQIPAEGHDAPMDCIITENEVIQCRTI